MGSRLMGRRIRARMGLISMFNIESSTLAALRLLRSISSVPVSTSALFRLSRVIIEFLNIVLFFSELGCFHDQ